MKLLAAQQPLSLQAHPDAARAAIQHTAGNPNYTDGHHKPELLVALEPFEVLCGFRHPAASVKLLMRVPALAGIVELLRRGDLRSAVIALLSAGPSLIDGVLSDAASLMPQQRELIQTLTAYHPGDPGALVALLLNQHLLNPGEGVFMPAGNLHAYLSGFGVEIMAASDNVLRAGLTTKHVDIPELLDVVRFEPLANPVVRAESPSPGLLHWPAPAEEFSLHKACVDPETPKVDLPGQGDPRIVICTDGQVEVNGLALSQGDAAFAEPNEPAISVTGNGYIFQAGLGNFHDPKQASSP
jgi:mannose-6-phosphate isomerase